MIALYSGLGSVINMTTSLLIAIRLFKPAREEGFKFTSFRGSLFWMFVNMAVFQFFMSGVLISDNYRQVGIWAYTFGHIFLYIGLALYIFAPFSIIAPGKKFIAWIICIITAITGAIVTYINWSTFATTNDPDMLPIYVENVVDWNPPDIVFIFIALCTMILWVGFGTIIFWYHASQTKVPLLRRRSFLIGLGLLITAIGGPLHDGPLVGATILIADVVTSLGLVITSIGVLLRVKR